MACGTEYQPRLINGGLIMTERLNSDIGGLPSGEVPREEVPQLFWEKHMIAMFNVLRSKDVFYGRRIDAMAELLIEKKIIDRNELAARTEDILRKGTRDHVP
jgi:hypothetical protein